MELDDLKQFHGAFFDEARDHVRTLEERLLELETHPGDAELLGALFRAAHSIKGASGILGFETITQLTHAMENVLDAMRESRLATSPALTSLLLESTDLLGTCVESAAGDRPAPAILEVVARLDATAPREGATATSTAGQDEALGTRRWTVIFRPRPDCFAFGINPALVLRELVQIGQAEVDVLLDAVPPFEELDPERCSLGWRITLVTDATEKRIREVFMFVEDMCDLELSWSHEPGFSALPSAAPPPPQPSAPRVAAPQPAAALPPAPHASAPLPSAPRPSHPEAALAPTPSAPGGEHGHKGGADASTLRVTTEKVDRLVNLVGELVISQAMISRCMQDIPGPQLQKLREAVEAMETHTRDLQESVMNIRMVPIGSIFGRFRRLVRDLSATLGKDIQLETVGEDTELDKSMVESLADPLTHLVRNSADHGIERTEDRLAAGKPAAGHVVLSARHQGGNVVVDITDDGRGLDTERIRAKAVERGIIVDDAQLSTEQIHELIFAPGFSTAATVTGLSGRGVGMDVVKRSVEALSGSVTLSSTPGEGSRFRLTLPLTLAILDGMALRVGNATFVLPLNQVVETLSMHKSKAVKQLLSSGEIILVRGETLPLVRLGKLLGVEDDGAQNARPLAVVLEVGEVRFGMMVDELLGKSQYVIKNLEPNFQKLDGLLGATILGDGTVSLILDVQALARMGNVRSREDRESIMAATSSRREATA